MENRRKTDLKKYLKYGSSWMLCKENKQFYFERLKKLNSTCFKKNSEKDIAVAQF
jgi:hypothetical protein